MYFLLFSSDDSGGVCNGVRFLLGFDCGHYLHRVSFPWFWPPAVHSRADVTWPVRLSGSIPCCRWLWVCFIIWLVASWSRARSTEPVMFHYWDGWDIVWPFVCGYSAIPFPITHSSILSVLSFILRTPSSLCSSCILFLLRCSQADAHVFTRLTYCPPLWCQCVCACMLFSLSSTVVLWFVRTTYRLFFAPLQVVFGCMLMYMRTTVDVHHCGCSSYPSIRPALIMYGHTWCRMYHSSFLSRGPHTDTVGLCPSWYHVITLIQCSAFISMSASLLHTWCRRLYH